MEAGRVQGAACAIAIDSKDWELKIIKYTNEEFKQNVLKFGKCI